MGGTWNAFSNDEEMELLITWLMPHQQIRPEMANKTARTDFLLPAAFPFRFARRSFMNEWI